MFPFHRWKKLRLRSSPQRAQTPTPEGGIGSLRCFRYTPPFSALSALRGRFFLLPGAVAPKLSTKAVAFGCSKPQLPRQSVRSWEPRATDADLLPPSRANSPTPQGRPAGNTHGSRRPRRLGGAHPLPGLRTPREQPNAGLGCLLSLGHQIILALAEGTDGN